MQPKKSNIGKINFKNQKGSITLFVLVAILFFLIVVLSVYTSNQNKKITQLGQVDKIIKDYEKDVENIDQIYEDEINEGAGIDFETNFIKSSSINSGNKIYYDIDSWTNEDIVVEIVLKDETFGPDVQIIIKSDSTGLENIYTYDEAKNNEVIITENSEVIIKIKDEEKEYHLTKFDKEKPIVSYESFFEKDGSKYTSGSWTNKETYTKIQAIENISGIETIEYSNDKNT